jgi:hypothetical protein
VRKIQAEHPNNSLLLFSGDVYSPSLMGAVFRGKEMQAVLNVMKPDVGCLGNHDFDYSMEELDKVRRRALLLGGAWIITIEPSISLSKRPSSRGYSAMLSTLKQESPLPTLPKRSFSSATELKSALWALSKMSGSLH